MASKDEERLCDRPSSSSRKIGRLNLDIRVIPETCNAQQRSQDPSFPAIRTVVSDLLKMTSRCPSCLLRQSYRFWGRLQSRKWEMSCAIQYLVDMVNLSPEYSLFSRICQWQLANNRRFSHFDSKIDARHSFFRREIKEDSDSWLTLLAEPMSLQLHARISRSRRTILRSLLLSKSRCSDRHCREQRENRWKGMSCHLTRENQVSRHVEIVDKAMIVIAPAVDPVWGCSCMPFPAHQCYFKFSRWKMICFIFLFINSLSNGKATRFRIFQLTINPIGNRQIWKAFQYAQTGSPPHSDLWAIAGLLRFMIPVVRKSEDFTNSRTP
jgi:hypothetical protein